MANLRVRWVLPTTRDSGKPLNPADIANVKLEISADLGVNYVVLGTFPPNVLETLVQDIDYGDWYVRGTVEDTAGRVSDPAVASVLNPDTTPPGALALTLSLE